MLKTVRSLPKIDLHRHLDGDVRGDTLLDLARRSGIPLPAESPAGLRSYFDGLRRQGIIPLFQKGFGLVTSLMQTEENLFLVAYEEVRNLAKEGIIYAEIRFAPQYHTGEASYYGHKLGAKKLTYTQIIRAVARGLKSGNDEFGLTTRLIVCIGRESEPATGIEVAQAALACVADGVAAIDLACDESSYPPERHKDAYHLTCGTPLYRTVHAGEFGPQREKNIRTAIEELQANRLGHAIRLIRHADLIELVKERHIGIEMCPRSNRYCGFIHAYRELGIPQLLAQNVLVTVNSDDPAMFGYDLNDVIAALKFDWQTVKRLQLNAIATAFLDRQTKAELGIKFQKLWEQRMAEIAKS